MITDEQLEAELARLRPAPLSPPLRERLSRARPPAPRVIAWPLRLARPALPLAAAAALVLWISRPDPAPVPAPGAEVAAVDTRDYILGTEELGVGHDEAGQPYRIVRSIGVRRVVWRGADGTEVAQVEPQQQLLLAKMDVY